MTAVDLDLLLDGLAVSDLGGLENSLDLVLALELCHQDGKLHVAGTGDDEFLGLGIVAVGEGGVFLVQLDKAVGDLVFRALDLGIDSHLVHRLVISHALDGDGLTGHAQRVAGLDGGELGENADVAAADLGGLDVVLALREEHVAELFRIAGAGVYDGHGVFHVAGDDLEVGVLAVLVRQGVENERHGAALRVELERNFLIVLDRGHGLAFQRVGGKLHKVVQKDGGAETRHRAAAEHGRDGALTDTGLDAGEDLFLGEGLLGEELLHELLAGLSNLLIELHHILLDLLLGVGGKCDLLAGGVIRLLCQQVNNADGLFAVQDREYERNDRCAEHFAQAVKDIEIVGVFFIQLGDVEHRGQVGLGKVLPALFGADTDAALGGDADHAGVCNAQALHDLAGKVEVTGVIQHIDLALVIFDGNDGGRDRILSLLLFVVEVRNGRTVGALAQTGDRLGREQHAFAQRGFTIATMAQQADVANVIGSIAHSLRSPFYRYSAPVAWNIPRQYTD